MSSRTLRKLEQDRLHRGTNISDEEYEESYEPAAKSYNAFALLNEEEEEEEEENEQEEEQEEKEENHEIEKETIDQYGSQQFHKKETVPASNNPNKLKESGRKKKKGKRKGKALLPKPRPGDSDEELERILKEVQKRDKKVMGESNHSGSLPTTDQYDFESELNMDHSPALEYDSNFKHFTTERLAESLNLLSIGSIKNLDADNELRNLFGELSTETIEEANTTTSLAISPELLQQFRRLAKLTRGWGGKDRRSVPGTTRRLLLSRIRDDWLPTTQKPLLMEEIVPNNVIDYLAYKEDSLDREDLAVKVKKEHTLGVRYFKFNKVQSAQERVADSRFYASVVMTPDPDSLMTMIQQYPYHVETLLQVAMVLLRQGDQKAVSNALVERCLFVFDRSFHKRFHELLLEGKNGLIRLPYESFMNRQFYLCLFRYIIALGERSTFLTAFSYCKLLLSLSPAEDPLGVRYFIDFYAILSEEYKFLIELSSSPLVKSYERWNTPGIAFSTVLAYHEMGRHEDAKAKLREAFLQYPHTALKLLEFVGLSSTLPIRESEIRTTDEALIASETYLVRAPLLWNTASKKQFLHDELLNLFNTNIILKGQSSVARTFFNFFSKKEETNEDIPFNLLRFAILSGENKIMAKIPNSVWDRNDLLEFDVLPPKDETITYDALTGVDEKDDRIITESLLDFVDQNIIASIVQNRTEEDNFEEILRQLQLREIEEAENQE